MNAETQKVLERLKKMLALAHDSGATDAERETAMRMAHKLLAKHNLSMAQVEAAGKKSEEKRVIGTMMFYGRPWAQSCCHSIAKLFFCEYVVGHARIATDTRHYFIGKESNSVTAAEMAKFVVESIRRESKTQARRLGQGNAYARSFATGAAAMVCARVEKMLKEAAGEKADKSTGKEIVLASVYQTEKSANLEFMQEKMQTKKGIVRAKQDHNVDAYHNGTVYGSEVPLNRQLEKTV